MMYSIHLDKMIFYAHHGVHDEETLAGGEFEVNVTIHFLPAAPVKILSDTLNYVDVYQVIKERMAHPVHLLEVLAEQIIADIHQMDNRINSISIEIKKLHPPIQQFSGTIGVSMFKEFNEHH